MKRDPVEKIDEFLAFASAIAGGLTAKTHSKESPQVKAELNILFHKVMDVIKSMTDLTSDVKKSAKMKKAVQVVIKKEGLNKNWAKLLQKYVKQYA